MDVRELPGPHNTQVPFKDSAAGGTQSAAATANDTVMGCSTIEIKTYVKLKKVQVPACEGH